MTDDYVDQTASQPSQKTMGKSVSFTEQVEPEPLGGEMFMGDISAQHIEDVLSDDSVGAAAGEDSEYEMVEEEVEEELDEMFAGERCKKKVKRMVKRKKKKNQLIKLVDRNKAAQMPEWTEALEIEYMNKEELNRVISRLRKEGMSESDIKLAEDLHYRRATFSMDQYVKLSEIRQVVAEAINSILDRMGKADGIARKNRTEINLLNDKLKAQQQQVNHLKRIEAGQASLIRLQKDQQARLAENFIKLGDIQHDVKQYKETQKLVQQDIKVQFHDVNTRATMAEHQMKLQDERMTRANLTLHEFIENSKLTFGAKMTELERQVKALPNELEQNMLIVRTMKSEIVKKTEEQFTTICTTLKIDTDRLTDLERSNVTLDKMVRKVELVEMEVQKLRHIDEEMFQANCFIERVLPIQIHHQVCEGLNIVAGTDIQELLKFEREKSAQLSTYMKQCDGYKPGVKRLRTAMENFHHHIHKSEIGSAPFIFGEMKDYWPDIPEKQMKAYDKRYY